MWPSVFTISTAALCIGLIDAMMDARGAERFVRPFHHYCTLTTVFVVCVVFWTLFRQVAFLRRRGAFVLSILFVAFLFGVWSWTLPLGDRIAIHYERLDPFRPPGDTGYGWFYWDDSGMGNWPMRIGYLLWTWDRPWLLLMLLAFYPCFFYLHRNSNEPGNA
jgi:hypothetical protein